MKDSNPPFTFDLTNLDRPTWMRVVEETSEDFGFATPIGLDHLALMIDGGRTLVVSFETVAKIRKNNDGNAPLGWGFVQSHGWSSLTLMADAKEDWFRHPALFGYFDRLIDDGFFDEYDEVLFYGAGPAGYAAAAFSVAAPDARVLVIQPQATLDPQLSRWDRRFPQTRRLDFTSRYGYAPMMCETAQDVWVVHDPSVIEDGMHASLFKDDNTTHLTCAYLGPQADRALASMGILDEMIEQAMDGTLNAKTYGQLWRARQNYMPYLRTLLYRLDVEDDKQRLLARLCRAVTRGDAERPLFRDKLAELEAEGIILEEPEPEGSDT